MIKIYAMENAFFKYLLDNAPALGGMLILLAVAWRLFKYHSSIEDTKKAVNNLEKEGKELRSDFRKDIDEIRFDFKEHRKMLYETDKKLDLLVCKVDNLTDRFDRLECNSHNNKLNNLESRTSHIEGALNIKTKVIDWSKKKSPLTLTEEGDKELRKYNLYAMIDDNWNKISSALREQESQNPFDIDNYCRVAAFADTLQNKPLEFFTDKDIDRLKRISYITGNHPLEYTEIMGIVIRDKYFEEVGINPDNIEGYDPSFELEKES
jgi:hypothetical protein